MPNEIPVIFYNSSNYGYHIIIKNLAEELERQYEYLGENTEKYNNFFVPLEKEIKKVDKVGNENIITITYKVQFIDSARFKASLFSNLVDNFAKGIYKIKCKGRDCFFEYENVNNNL